MAAATTTTDRPTDLTRTRPDPTRPDPTVSHQCSSTTKPQEAKKEARIEREEFALTGGNKKLTKKERKRLEQEE